MDNFEKYIRENRLKLDTEDLEPDFKNHLKNSFNKTTKKRMLNYWYLIASVVIISLSVLLFMEKNKNNRLNFYRENKNSLATEFNSQEDFYSSAINQQVKIIEKEKINKENLVYFNEFIEQLKTIDNQYKLINKQIKKQGYTEDLIEQLMYIYKLKLSVLQMMQKEIKKINNRTKIKNHEKENIRIY